MAVESLQQYEVEWKADYFGGPMMEVTVSVTAASPDKAVEMALKRVLSVRFGPPSVRQILHQYIEGLLYVW